MKITLCLSNVKSEAAKTAVRKLLDDAKMEASDWQALKADKVITRIPKSVNLK